MQENIPMICIDPGHGGSDPGAVCGALFEKDINLTIAKSILTYLTKNYRCNVILTREKDIDVSLAKRAEIANKLNVDIFLSIHVNAGGGRGFETYSHTSAPPITKQIHEKFHKQIIDEFLTLFLGKKYDIVNRGIKSANFQVLRQTTMPAFLVENFFIDSMDDIYIINNKENQNQIGYCIGQALATIIKLEPLTRPTNDNMISLVNDIEKQYLIIDKTLQDMATILGKLQQAIIK
jgi:N-acetylmuramoyl-L-alanine amidase